MLAGNISLAVTLCSVGSNKYPHAGVITAELAGCTVMLAPKYAVEVREIVEAAGKGNFGNCQGRIDEEPGCVPEPDIVQTFDKSLAGAFLDEAAKRYVEHIHRPGYVV